jgi:hypothetical protein
VIRPSTQGLLKSVSFIFNCVHPGYPRFTRPGESIVFRTPPYCGLGVVVGDVVVVDGDVFGCVVVVVVVGDGADVVGVVLAQAGKSNASRRSAKNP